MKKLLLGIFVLLMSVTTYAKVEIDDSVPLQGDAKFVSKIRNLPETTPVKADAIYVATNGDDNNTGSQDKPYKTINKALQEVKAGGQVVVRGGKYMERLTFVNSGTEDNYIVVMNYPGETPTLDNTGSDTEGLQVNFNGQSYIQFEGFEVCNNSATWAHSVYLNKGENHIIIRKNDIHDVRVKKPKSWDNGGNAIIIYAEYGDKCVNNVYIADNHIHDCETGWSEALTVTGNAEYINVVNNVVTNTGNIGIDFSGNFGFCNTPSVDQARYGLIMGNVVSECNSPNATSAGIYCDGSRDIIVQNNVVHSSQAGIQIGSEKYAKDTPVKNVTVRNNLVYNCSDQSISVGGWDLKTCGTVYNTKVYNNTIYTTGGALSGIYVKMVDGLDIRNNILYNASKQKVSMYYMGFDENNIKNLSFANNHYYSTLYNDKKASFMLYKKYYYGIDAWNEALGGGTESFGDGIFTDVSKYDFTLKEGASSVIDRGDNTADYGVIDLNNNKRVSNGLVDIGCYEYQNPDEVTTQTTTEIPIETTTEIPIETTTQAPTGEKGDVDKNGQLTATDSAKVLAYVLNVDDNPLDDVAISLADVDESGSVTASDAASILAKVLNSDYLFKK